MKRVRKLGWIVLLFCASLWGAPYTDNGNGTVTDSATGLIWQKCSNGQNATSCSGSTSTLTLSWSSAITYCEGLTLGSRSDWRLPNINELGSIIDYTKSSVITIDSTAFPNTQSYFYWSSSTYAQNTNYAWLVDFNYGNLSVNSKTDRNIYGYVRCVTGP
jgi:hypothetical protein